MNKNRIIKRGKARIVARGFTQRPGIDYEETFALVARQGSVRLITALAAGIGAKIHQLHVMTAYFNAEQRAVALSKTRAEFRVLIGATKESIHLKGFLYELGSPNLSARLLYCDNQGTVQLTTTTGYYDRIKHVRIHFNFVGLSVTG